jgi:hypothetical protein
MLKWEANDGWNSAGPAQFDFQTSPPGNSPSSVLMKSSKLGSLSFRTGFACAAIALAATTSQAEPIHLAFTGMNLVYDGSTLRDAGSATGGVLNPANADPINSLDFFDNGVPQGSLSSNISVDVSIPDVTNLTMGPNSSTTVVTPGNPGYFDLLIGTSPLASEYLALELDHVTITYLDIFGLVQVNFGAAVADSSSQNLPFGLDIGDLVTLTFSAQVDTGSLTGLNGIITGFTATGTGDVRQAVPEPSSVVLCAMGAVAIPVLLRRRRR